MLRTATRRQGRPDGERPRVVVCGSRWFDDLAFVKAKLDYYVSLLDEPVVVIGGDECVFDRTAKAWALKAGHTLKLFHPDKERYPPPACYHVRNREMIQEACSVPGQYGFLVAFWDGRSPGTQSMIEMAGKKKVRVKVVEV